MSLPKDRQMWGERNCLGFETAAGGIEPSSPRLTVRRSTEPPPLPTGVDSREKNYVIYFQELTQEKHELRLRLESIEGQYELTVRDLQHEVSQLRDDLADQEETLRVGERSHSQALTDAKRQNEHLAEQIHKVGREGGGVWWGLGCFVGVMGYGGNYRLRGLEGVRVSSEG